MHIIPFKPAHLSRVAPQRAQEGVAGAIDRATADSLALSELAFSAAEAGRIVGCAGIVPLWPGVGQAWAVLSDAALSHPVILTRAVQRELAHIETKLALRRVQATVAEDHVEGRRWLAWLGFEVEGLMRNYGPGGNGDYWLYGRAA
jgi:hypothetical protein